MEQTPNIIMKCPKCLREFPLDVTCCDSCSAMLEPYVSGEGEPIGSPVMESAEDIRVDHLRADIEDKFIYALLYERDNLKKKLSEKERAVQELQEREAEIGYHALILALGHKEHEKDEILKRLGEIDTTLEEMKGTVETQVRNLTTRLMNLPEPEFLWFLKSEGRYHRRLSNELETQGILLDILLGKRPANYFRVRRLGNIYLLIALTVVFTLITSWQIFTHRDKDQKVSSALLNREADKGMVKNEDIIALLEDIKRANVSKDIGLWESRYSRQYLQLPGKRESVAELWRNYDFQSLDYTLEDVAIERERARALVTWKMGLFSKKTNETKAISQRLRADFIVEDGKLKIRSVEKQ